LQEQKKYDIDIMENELRTFRIQVKEMDSPAKISFNYNRLKPLQPSGLKIASPLQVFISFSNKEPRKN